MPLRRVIQRKVEEPLADAMLSGGVKKIVRGSRVTITASGDGEELSIDIK